MTPTDHRELLGQLVRMEWEKWAREQPNPKTSWLTPWAALTEPEREVDRRIGERIEQFVLGALSHPSYAEAFAEWCSTWEGHKPATLDDAFEAAWNLAALREAGAL